jgi:hypothetical protein
MRTKNTGSACAGNGLLAATGPTRTTGNRGSPALLRALNTLRQQGCDKGAGPAARCAKTPRCRVLRRSSRAATSSTTHSKASGYRAYERGANHRARRRRPGRPDAQNTGQDLRHGHAAELLDVGFYQRGTQTWVVLAAPFSPPAAAQAAEVAVAGAGPGQ